MNLHGRHSLNLFGRAAVVAAAVGMGIAAPAGAGTSDRPAIEWGGTTHATRASLEDWLTERGLSYNAWAYQHPIAALQLDRAEERAAAASTTPARRQAPSPTRSRSLSVSLLASVVALGLVLGTIALVLSSASMRFKPSLRFVSDRRAYIAFAGAACVAVATASYAAQL